MSAHNGKSLIYTENRKGPIIYIYVASWTHACRVNENGNCFHSKKTGKVILVTRTTISRPIAIVMAVSKIVELCIMRKVQTQLITSDN